MRHRPHFPGRSPAAFLAFLILWSTSLWNRSKHLEAFLWSGVDGLVPLSKSQSWSQRRVTFRKAQGAPAESTTVCDGEPLTVEADSDDCDLSTIQRLTADSILFRGEPIGLSSLTELAELSARRKPFDFGCCQFSPHENEETVLANIPGLLPLSTTDDIYRQVQAMQQRGWLSTNPDSVDGQPSCHINLISNGRPLASSDDDFGASLRGLVGTVTSLVYQDLLPRVQAMVKSTTLQVGDVFIRRYGQDVLEGKSRSGLSAHYDVYSMVTSVIALDDAGAQGTNGLYTTVRNERGETSNHAALRRFFPLACGDAVVHTWDVLHGVDVQPNRSRTSLIVWFTTSDECTLRSKFVAPWVLRRRHEPVGQFVLASALEETRSVETNPEQDSPFDLYLRSALSGSAFSQSRLGALCEEGSLSELDLDRAEAAVDTLEPNFSSLRSCVDNDALPRSLRLARLFWLEASLRGNPFAQIALAEEIMSNEGSYVDGEDGDEDVNNRRVREARLLAAVLFGLAAQQGDAGAADALERVVALEISAVPGLTEEEFMAHPTVQVAMAAMSV